MKLLSAKTDADLCVMINCDHVVSAAECDYLGKFTYIVLSNGEHYTLQMPFLEVAGILAAD